MADDDAVHASGHRTVPRRPDKVELAVLTALADTYGSEILHNASLGYSLRVFARYGGVAFVQRVLWGESASDVQLATTLGVHAGHARLQRRPYGRSERHPRRVQAAAAGRTDVKAGRAWLKTLPPTGYTTKDLAAVRAYVQRAAPAMAGWPYYDLQFCGDAVGNGATPSHMRKRQTHTD
ncbi:hypothetical protein [Caballeronia sp. DA-9]|uniref:hypothetical protein n=1 Tax=Caballeronia sp. DA-9 TaxID=3436237 RepID=UPI003F6643F2